MPPVAPSVPPAAKSAAGWKKLARSVARAESNRKKAAKPPDLDTILDHFSDSLALVETAYAVLDAAQEDWDADCCGSDVAPAVLTLELGVKELRRLHRNLDIAILARRRQ